jgi:c(7)-type cytochrome triheme protein
MGLKTWILAAGSVLACSAGLASLAGMAHAADAPSGKSVYEATCIACHVAGVAGAPKLGDAAAWAPRLKAGVPALVGSALKGKGAMPPRGGNATLSDEAVRAAVEYMVAQSGGAAEKPAAAAKPAAPAARPAAAAAPAKADPPAPTPAPAAPAAAAAATATMAAAATPEPARANAFNRLMRAPSQRNRPPAEDQIHDPTNDGTLALQAPLTAFGPLPKSTSGNRIDWVKSLNEGKIEPRADRNDPKAAPAVMDLNIVREVKGSMPDVVYPHKQHTEWLDCSNCHPAIFVPQKGANQISMAAILLGQKCGVCHGKVAFPVSDCVRCHSKPKARPTAAGASAPGR